MSYFFDARQIDRQGRGGKQAHLRPSLRIGRREDTRGYVRETLLYRFGRYRRQPDKPSRRVLISFSHEEHECIEETLCIEVEHHQFTPEYIALTKDFYLKM